MLDRRESEGAVAAVTGDQMRAAVLQLYFADYIKQWDALAGRRQDHAVFQPRPGRPHHQRAGGGRLAAARLPAGGGEGDHAGRPGGKPAAAALDEAVRNKLAAARKKLESALGGDDAPAAPSRRPIRSTSISTPLHKLVGAPGATAPAPLDALLAMLKDASQYFDAADSARRGGTPAPPAEVLQRLKREAEGKPAPLGAMLQNIDSAGAGLTLGSERARLQALVEFGRRRRSAATPSPAAIRWCAAPARKSRRTISASSSARAA